MNETRNILLPSFTLQRLSVFSPLHLECALLLFIRIIDRIRNNAHIADEYDVQSLPFRILALIEVDAVPFVAIGSLFRAQLSALAYY